MDQHKTALIVGANGVIGGNLARYLETLDDWSVIGLSRRGGQSTGKIRHISVDLLDPTDCLNKLADLTDVTHIFYAAYQERPTFAELVAPNLAMLVNTVTTIEKVAPNLAHVSLMQGYKVYGAHLGPFKTPAREDEDNHMPPEFNMDQQAFLQKQQQGKSWTWSALRPSVVIGTATGNPMNLAMVIGLYAAMSKELGLPLRFPGKPGAYDTLLEMTDAGEGNRLGRHPSAMRQPGLQHHQWRPVPLERDVAEDRPLLRHGNGGTAADVAPWGDGGQSRTLADDERKIRACRSPL